MEESYCVSFADSSSDSVIVNKSKLIKSINDYIEFYPAGIYCNRCHDWATFIFDDLGMTEFYIKCVDCDYLKILDYSILLKDIIKKKRRFILKLERINYDKI